MPDILALIISTIKGKITPIWTKVKLWTNPAYVRTWITMKLKTFFSKKLSVKPRHQKDYYTVFNWLVSKRLVSAVILLIGALGFSYLCFIQPLSVFKDSDDGVKTYQYNALMLRFTSDKVKIKAKSGYVAYEGQVVKGKAQGSGNLYDKMSNLIYQGEFEQGKYHGAGKLFYPNNQLNYQGKFRDNLFDEEGILYRSNGSKEYEGAFLLGMKEGKGILYDTGNHPIFEGSFKRDQILYSDFLGKTTQEVSESYTGKRKIYTFKDEFMVVLSDIDALYCGNSTEENLDDSMSVGELYIMKDYIWINDKVCRTQEEISHGFGEKVYEGNTEIKPAEAVAIDRMAGFSDKEFTPVKLLITSVFTDVHKIDSFESDYYVYLVAYEQEGIVYTFFFREPAREFFMYMMEREE